ncbi:hypothetical protein CPT_Moby_121 [Stenotrophomonas phage Moby]|uniref:Uncharacterized protein n=1 Tax=Stenotrophomonas phage Moby TaxID=2601680 RepID=A0A5P8PM91_9CAUD|nr:hypothetical protein HWC58_gp257 [Stenotrophomonas phage Moby]QFR57866.1 hypothetical protein CPT_Moby_121 [Stenotrophomonas phage Moby]
MKWRPHLALKVAQTKGDRHWWTRTADGFKLHSWFSIHTVENEEDQCTILQVFAGPILLNIASKY